MDKCLLIYRYVKYKFFELILNGTFFEFDRIKLKYFFT